MIAHREEGDGVLGVICKHDSELGLASQTNA